MKHPGFCQTHIFIRTAGIADGTVVRIDGKQNSGIVKFPERIVCKIRDRLCLQITRRTQFHSDLFLCDFLKQ